MKEKFNFSCNEFDIRAGFSPRVIPCQIRHLAFTTAAGAKPFASILYVLVLFIMYACDSKGAFISDVREFVVEVEANAKNYDATDWEVKDVEFEKFFNKEIAKHKKKLTDEDRKELGKLQARYLKVRVEHAGKQLLDGLKEGLKYMEGFMEGLLEDSNKSDKTEN